MFNDILLAIVDIHESFDLSDMRLILQINICLTNFVSAYVLLKVEVPLTINPLVSLKVLFHPDVTSLATVVVFFIMLRQIGIFDFHCFLIL